MPRYDYDRSPLGSFLMFVIQTAIFFRDQLSLTILLSPLSLSLYYECNTSLPPSRSFMVIVFVRAHSALYTLYPLPFTFFITTC